MGSHKLFRLIRLFLSALTFIVENSNYSRNYKRGDGAWKLQLRSCVPLSCADQRDVNGKYESLHASSQGWVLGGVPCLERSTCPEICFPFLRYFVQQHQNAPFGLLNLSACLWNIQKSLGWVCITVSGLHPFGVALIWLTPCWVIYTPLTWAAASMDMPPSESLALASSLSFS